MEIAYCAQCQSRVTGQDLESGRAVRSGGRVYCRTCAPARPEASPASRPEAQSPAPAAVRPATARRKTGEEAAASGKTGLFWGGAIAFVALALGFVVWVTRPVERPVPSDPLAAAAPAAPRVSRPIPPTAPVDSRSAHWSQLEAEVKQACAHEEFGRAVESLELAASGSSDRDWTWMIQRRQSEVRARAKSLLEDLALQAAAAKARGADAEAASIAARVAAWRLADCKIVLPEKPAAPAPVDPVAPATGTPPAIVQAPPSSLPLSRAGASALPAIAIYDQRLVPGWDDWSWDAQRSFDSTDFVSAGQHSIRVIFAANGAALYLHAQGPLDVDGLEAFEFSCRVEGKCPQILVKFSDENKQFWGTLDLSKMGGPPPSGEWKRYEYPFAPHRGTGKKVQGLVFQAVYNVSSDPVYFADLRLRPGR